MTAALVAATLVSLAGRAGRAADEVVVVKAGGVAAFEAIAEEFADHCRVRTRLINLVEKMDVAALRRELKPEQIVFAIGQPAVDALRGTPTRVISACVFSPPPGVTAADPLPSPAVLLRTLQQLKPQVRRVGVVFGPATRPLVERAEVELGSSMTLVEIFADDGSPALRQLHRLAPTLDAVWLTPDLQVITSQLFRYALTLEVRFGCPVIAATRQQVLSGALLAYDLDAHSVGLQAAELVHQLSAGAVPSPAAALRPTMTLNGDVARRLGISPARIRAAGVRIE